MKKEGALSKIGEGAIDNQWFKGAILTIVPRTSQDRSKRVPRESTLQGGNGKIENGKWKIENGGILFESNSRRPNRRSETHVSQKTQK